MSDEQKTEAEGAETETGERRYATRTRGQRKVLEGIVISTGMAKTAVVAIERMERHAKYKKYIRRHSKVYAHDENNEAVVGDMVRVVECRPMSKLKRFRFAGVIKKN